MIGDNKRVLHSKTIINCHQRLCQQNYRNTQNTIRYYLNSCKHWNEKRENGIQSSLVKSNLVGKQPGWTIIELKQTTEDITRIHEMRTVRPFIPCGHVDLEASLA